ncbi:MAG: type IV pilus modification protein PilV [Variovorax sp.]|nr:MAG: type IV pilus modification protein PilV [Variovorax sp.]
MHVQWWALENAQGERIVQLTRIRTGKARQAGITLLESLAALVVLAVAVLGMLGVQLRTLAETQTGVRRAQAVRLIEDFAERIKNNPGGFAQLPNFVADWTAMPAASSCVSASCDAASLAAWDLRSWKQSVAQTLPMGKACVFESSDETTAGLKRQLGVMVGWRANERDTSTAYLDPLEPAGAASAAACPAGLICHLVYVQP